MELAQAEPQQIWRQGISQKKGFVSVCAPGSSPRAADASFGAFCPLHCFFNLTWVF